MLNLSSLVPPKKLKRSEKAKRKVGLCNYLLCYCGLLLQLQIQMQMQMQRTCTVSSNFTSFSGVGLMATRCVRSLLFLSNCVFNFLNKGKDHFHLRRKSTTTCLYIRGLLLSRAITNAYLFPENKTLLVPTSSSILPSTTFMF